MGLLVLLANQRDVIRGPRGVTNPFFVVSAPRQHRIDGFPIVIVLLRAKRVSLVSPRNILQGNDQALELPHRATARRGSQLRCCAKPSRRHAQPGRSFGPGWTASGSTTPDALTKRASSGETSVITPSSKGLP